MARSKPVKVAAAEMSSSAVDRAASTAAAATATATPSSSSALTTTARVRSTVAALRRMRAGLPEPAQLALAIVLSFSLNAAGQFLVHSLSGGELSSIMWQPSSAAGSIPEALWRIFGLTLAWFGNFDGYDLAALALLSSGPAAYLTSVFYGVRTITAGAHLGVDVLSSFLPFFLLRQLSGAHSAAPGVTNREIIVDRGIQVLTSVLSGQVYSIILFLASRAFLPDTLVLYFEGIPTVRPATDATVLGNPTTHVVTLLLGTAARLFIFTPLVATPQTGESERELAKFDPVSATLQETVAYNLWGYTSRTKVSIKRTALAMLFTGVGTYLRCLGIRGAEPYGSIVYASVWTMATLLAGLSLRYVGSV
ncbi:hypothetical protein QBC47DRAFT_390931 [Echria macrotheca]|uniref:Uncharacterized protein n=1 Tax=Echria macrotheca TaxID=438768 RepID=A0AAJ0F318_9PEZI|nr:hypothetical protein QBC47DRAFT_390931 [Echria macrotheca]